MATIRCILALAFVLGVSAPLGSTDTVTRIDDEKLSGTVTGVDSGGKVTVRTGAPDAARIVTIPAAEVLSVRFGNPSSARRDGDLLTLASGERYYVLPAAAVESPAAIRCTSGACLHGSNLIRFADLRAYVPGGKDADHVLREITSLTNDRDVVLTSGGDRLTGVVESVVYGAVGVTAKVGKVQVKREMLRGVAFSKTLKPYNEPKRLLAEVRLADGSVVVGDIQGPQRGQFTLRSVLGSSWEVSVAKVCEVRFRGGKLVWLSELEPVKAEMTPFFNRSWSWRREQSVWGNPLTVDGTVYERGLGVHSRTELTYDIGRRYVTFVADVGIDDETKGTGSAMVSVTGDGRALLTPTEVSAGHKPRHVKLNVTGVQRLHLLVDFGKDEDFGDHVDWLNARLIRK